MGSDETIASDRNDRRAVTAFFDDRVAAQTAVDDLVAAGVARDRVTLVEGGADPVAVGPEPRRDWSLWDDAKNLFLGEDDRRAYGEGLRRGGFLLSVATGSQDHDRVVALLDREGAVDMDARESDWALQGWDPTRAARDLGAAGDLSAPADAGSAGATIRRDASPSRVRTFVENRVRRDPGA